MVLAKYGAWESVIGGIIDWFAPEVRCLSDHQKETLAVDGEREETITFLKRLMIAFPRCGTNAIGVSQITEMVFPKEGKSTLRDFVPEGLLRGGSFAIRLGKWLKRVSTRRWERIMLIAEEDTHEGVWKYRICLDIKEKDRASKKSTLAIFDETDTVAA